MTTIFPGRYTAKLSQPCVVFLLGMRVNRFTAFRRWTKVARSLPPMMTALQQDPSKGLLESQMFFRIWPIEACIVSYWQSFEALTHFARSQEDPHWRAWQTFVREINNDGSVGIWHETYRITLGSYECIYGNMPVFGLAAAGKHQPISAKTRSAQQRMGTSH